MICNVCREAGDLQATTDLSGSKWLVKALKEEIHNLHAQCKSVTNNKSWCDCQHREKEKE